MTMLAAIQSAAQLLGGRLVTGFVAGLLLAALTALLIRFFRSSSTRFAIYFLTLLALAFLPIASCFVTSHVSGAQQTEVFVIPSRWAIALLAFWILGAGIGLTRICVGLWRVHRIRQRCVELDESFGSGSPAMKLNLADIQANRNVAVCVSDDVPVPTAIGFFRPAILLPSWAIRELSADEFNSILLHEFGHLRRHDDWTNLAQKILQAVLFFHPAIWWIDSRLNLEREGACDDLVVAKTCNAREYAKCLVSVAEKSMGRRAFAVAVAAVGRMRQTAVRLARILDQNRSVATRSSKPVLATFATLTLALLVEMPHVPTIVVFNDAAPTTVGQSRHVLGVAQPIPEVIPASAQFETGGVRHPILRKAELRTRGSVGFANLPAINSGQTKRARINRIEAKANMKPSLRVIRANWDDKEHAISNRADAAPTMLEAAPTMLLLTQMVVCDEYGNCFVSVKSWQVPTVQQTTDQTQKGKNEKSI